MTRPLAGSVTAGSTKTQMQFPCCGEGLTYLASVIYAAQAALTVSVFNIVSKRTISWASTENSLSGFLRIVGVVKHHEDFAENRC